MGNRLYWTRALSQEFWAGVVTPLMFSIAGGLIEERMAGKGLRILGMPSLADERFLRCIGGRVYLNSRILEEIVKRIPTVLVRPEVLRFLPEAIRQDCSGLHVSFSSPQSLRILFRIVATEKHWAPWSNYKAFEKAARHVEEAGREFARVPVEGLSEDDLLERSRTLYRRMGDFLEVVIWGMVFAYVTRPLTDHLARKWGGDAQGRLAASLRVGLNGIRTFEINREIEQLADEAARSPRLNELFDSADPATVLAALRREGEAEDFRARFEAFVDRYGHRFLGRDICHPTWRECPESVFGMIRINRGRDLCRRNFELQKRKREEAEKGLKGRIGRGAFGPFKWALFSLLLSYDRKYFVLRENMRYFADICLEQFRRIYLELGRRWQREGRLEQAEEIVFLRRDEIERAGRARGDVARIVVRRKREYDQASRLRPAEVIREGEDPFEAVPGPREERAVVRGEVASPGRARGPARIIREPMDLLGVRKGDILVARCTDPSWAPALPLAAGLVLEVGGLLSHGSIVAREYGIPALIQAEGAVEGLCDGDQVELDTDRKCVRRVSMPPYPLDNRGQIE